MVAEEHQLELLIGAFLFSLVEKIQVVVIKGESQDRGTLTYETSIIDSRQGTDADG